MFCRSIFRYLVDVVDKSQIEHAVSLIQHQKLDPGKVYGAPFRVIKHFVDPGWLQLRLHPLGWDCVVRRDGSDWVCGEARLARSRTRRTVRRLSRWRTQLASSQRVGDDS